MMTPTPFVNALDNCPQVSNFDQLNTDGDSEGDACDADDDNDTINDGSDNCPLISNLDQLNTDGDSEGDACDADDDNDGLSDNEEIAIYGTNPLIADTDEDGVNDGDEVLAGTDPLARGVKYPVSRDNYLAPASVVCSCEWATLFFQVPARPLKRRVLLLAFTVARIFK